MKKDRIIRLDKIRLIPLAVLCILATAAGLLIYGAGESNKERSNIAGQAIMEAVPGSPDDGDGVRGSPDDMTVLPDDGDGYRGSPGEDAQNLSYGIASPSDDGDGVRGSPGEKAQPDAEALKCRYFVERDFMKSVAIAGQDIPDSSDCPGNQGLIVGSFDSSEEQGFIAGGIVPHHLLAANMIAGFFQSMAENPPDTLIVVAPNHKRTGFNNIHSSSADWLTSFGLLETDRTLVEKLVREFGATLNNVVMEEEHSISSLVPYIKYYLPEVKIVPVLLHGNYPPEESKRLGSFFAELLADNPKTALVASVDFSHYLDSDTADKMDVITLEAIQSFDYAAISRMGNDNMDSPPSITSLLYAMQETDASGPEIIGHSNSYKLTGGGFDYTTSYYTIFYKRLPG